MLQKEVIAAFEKRPDPRMSSYQSFEKVRENKVCEGSIKFCFNIYKNPLLSVNVRQKARYSNRVLQNSGTRRYLCS